MKLRWDLPTLFVWLIIRDRKYYWLIYCKRKHRWMARSQDQMLFDVCLSLGQSRFLMISSLGCECNDSPMENANAFDGHLKASSWSRSSQRSYIPTIIFWALDYSSVWGRWCYAGSKRSFFAHKGTCLHNVNTWFTLRFVPSRRDNRKLSLSCWTRISERILWFTLWGHISLGVNFTLSARPIGAG